MRLSTLSEDAVQGTSLEAPPPQLGAPRHAQRTLLSSLPGLNGSCPASHSTVAVCRHHSSTQARPSAGRAELGGPGRSSPHCTCRPRSPVRRAAVGRPEAEYRTRERGQFSPCSGTQPVRGFHTGQKTTTYNRPTRQESLPEKGMGREEAAPAGMDGSGTHTSHGCLTGERCVGVTHEHAPPGPGTTAHARARHPP